MIGGTTGKLRRRNTLASRPRLTAFKRSFAMGFPHSHQHMGHPALSELHPHHPAYPYGPPMSGLPGMHPPSHHVMLPPGKTLLSSMNQVHFLHEYSRIIFF